ncbi:MAG: aminotransferase class I/II-fold pyridoxal phosphate-dependent enzyme, partial [Pseudomonadota bacterium]
MSGYQRFLQGLQSQLQARSEQQLLRTRRQVTSPQQPQLGVDGKPLLSFCSNDYLGLANHPDVVSAFKRGLDEYGAGSGASHLVTGHTAAHHALEEELADFTGRSRALLFGSGYMANVGVLTSLLDDKDQVFEDKLNHASLLDGGLFSGANFRRYPHKDSRR